jgi:anthranilate phosphoribosyltransferase
MSQLDDLGGWPPLIARLLAHDDLTADEAGAAMRSILYDQATPAQIAGYLVGLRSKGETVEELSGMLAAMAEVASIVPLSDDERAVAVDIVGTGGDGSHTVNVSTMAALVMAGAGAMVCKHGSRSASSKCGAADVLEHVGVVLELSPEAVASCVRDVGMGFCFAPMFHPAFRFAGSPRRELGVPTAFNLLGPMSNPARVRRQVIGVADPRFADLMIAALDSQGLTHAWVVHGDGLDELTTTGMSHVSALDEGVIETFVVDPRSLGLTLVDVDALVGGSPDDNARILHEVVDGVDGPYREIVLLNAAAGLVVGGHAEDLEEGIELAATSIDSGKAGATLAALIEATTAARG